MSNSLVTPWTVARQAPLSVGFPREEYWNGLPFPFPGDLLDPGIKTAFPALAGIFFTTEPPGKPVCMYMFVQIYILYIPKICDLFRRNDYKDGMLSLYVNSLKKKIFLQSFNGP